MVSAEDHEVLGSNPDYMTLYYAEPFIISFPSSRYESNNIERDVKHQNHHYILAT